MTEEERAVAIEKKIECALGIIFLLPPIIAVFCFLLNWFDWADGWFVEMRRLGGMWSYHYDQGGASSPAPIYLGLMALAGCYLVKDSLRYFFLKNVKKETKKIVTNSEGKKNTEYRFETNNINDALGI